MASLKEEVEKLETNEEGLTRNKVVHFSYTQCAYDTDNVNGVTEYNYSCEQNIPTADPSVVKVNETVLSKGYRSQASSLTRMLINHFFGRVSYNLNKINDNFKSFLTSFKSYIGKANGVASLDENGRIPYSQLPESAVEFKGTWDASTNTPALADGTGTKGDMYVVSVEGTQTFAGVETKFFVGDRILYNGSVWVKLASGDVKSVNSQSPDTTGNITLTGSEIKLNSNCALTLNDKFSSTEFNAGQVSTASSYGVAIGASSCAGACGVGIGKSSCAGNYSVAIGLSAGSYAFNYEQTVAIGYNARALGSYGISIGVQAGAGFHGQANVGIGTYALYGQKYCNQNAQGCSNTAIGYNALRNITLKTNCTANNDNTAIGANALYAMSTGSYNTAIGARALCCLTNGCENFGLGIDTGWHITTGCNNTLIGNNTGMGLCGNSSDNVLIGKNIACTGCYEICNSTIVGSKAGEKTQVTLTAFGFHAGYNNTTGICNLFIGSGSGYSNTTGCYNLFIGIDSGYNNTTGCYNTIIGNLAGQTTFNGCNNVIIGSYAGYYNDCGNKNVIIGDYAGCNNAQGCCNTFLGYSSGACNVSGHGNTFVGAYAGDNNTIGCYNIMLGEYAGGFSKVGCSNIFIGREAGYCAGVCETCNTKSMYNIFIGTKAGYCSIAGAYNVFLGTNAGWYVSNEQDYNVIVGNGLGSLNASGDFALGSKCMCGCCTKNNYIFTCNDILYWCHGTALTTLA